MAEASLTASSTTPAAADAAATIHKLSLQLKKLNDANGKYKNLLKLAKDRITKQEEELQSLQQQASKAAEERAAEESNASNIVLEDTGDENISIADVCLRLRVRNKQQGLDEIWALLEMEAEAADGSSRRRYPQWKKFNAESELSDFIRCDTGEPLVLPPYSLSPEQSAHVQEEAALKVTKVTEEFRRFRVRSELARKQADAQIRDLQSTKVQRVARDTSSSSAGTSTGGASTTTSAASANGAEMERLRAEMAAQEAHWKEAYDVLLAENKALKSSGSEAMLASQWRQRYETCAKEKEELEARYQGLQQSGSGDDGKYEAKYRDLKESFRLYRKKAKEIFQEQNASGGGDNTPPSAVLSSISSNSSADAKLSYLKNLMVNYFTCDQTMKDHMQSAIGTVLQFSPDELARIEKKRIESEAWF